MSNKTYTNPWAGLSSYQDPESADVQLKFCGRDNESFDVAQLVDDNIFVTLYGKSGTGKTSLLNAGVFPRLRQEQYLPVSIRLGMEAFDISFQQCVLAKISQALQGKGTQTTVEVVPMPADEQSTEYLWSYFARTRFMAADGSTLFPVLVFDQFEEVFRNRRDEAETLLRQIHFMMDENHALSDRMVDGQPYQYDFNFRFVASIREDDLYRLEDSIDNCYLPELKRCRYRLRSLSEQGASDVILIPGEGLFKAEEQKDIVDKIVSKSRNEDGSISTNIISLLCSRIYADYQRSGADHISPTLVDSFLKGNPFEQFYNEATRGFSNREKSYIEDHLIDSTGRRNSIPESDFLRYVKNGAVLLDGERKILQRTSSSSDSFNNRIELIHDSFCEPLLKNRAERFRRKRLIGIYFIFLLTLLSIVLFSFIFWRKVQSQAMSQYSIIIQEDSTICMTDYWKTNVVIVTGKDTLICKQLDKISNRYSLNLDPKNTPVVSVSNLIGNYNYFISDFHPTEKKHYEMCIRISRSNATIPISGKIVSKIGGIPIYDALVIIGEQVTKTNEKGLFKLYIDSLHYENDKIIRIIKDGYDYFECEVSSKPQTYKLKKNGTNFKEEARNIANVLDTSSSTRHFKGEMCSYIDGDTLHGDSQMEVCIDDSLMMGFCYYSKIYKRANPKYLSYFLINGHLNAETRTFSCILHDFAKNRIKMVGKISDDNVLSGKFININMNKEIGEFKFEGK